MVVPREEQELSISKQKGKRRSEGEAKETEGRACS